MTVTEYRRRLNPLLADARRAGERVREARQELMDAQEDAADAADAAAIIQELAQGVQQQAHARIAGIVTRALQTVFGPDAYEFAIEFEKKRNRTEARLLFLRNGHEIEPLKAAGGGCVDIAALALRVACLVMLRPAPRRIIISDEPMKNVNGSVYQDRVGQLIETLAEELDVQFIIVTDDDWLKIGKVVEL